MQYTSLIQSVFLTLLSIFLLFGIALISAALYSIWKITRYLRRILSLLENTHGEIKERLLGLIAALSGVPLLHFFISRMRRSRSD